jgi:thiopeptide-type bacteriocin biosynthesis protein
MQPAFIHHDEYVIRSPRYAYQQLFGPGETTLHLDEIVFRMLEDPVFTEGLYWSSPQLYQAVLAFRKGQLKASRTNKLMHTLKKYAIRASTRCTPYGIYAGCAIAHREGSRGTARTEERVLRADLFLLQQIIRKIESDAALWPHLCYRLNNSLYAVAGRYRFITTVFEEGKPGYRINMLEQTALLERIVSVLQQHAPVPIGTLCDVLRKKHTPGEVYAMAGQLIHRQFLVSELQPGITTDELGNMRKVLERLVEKGVTEAQVYLDVLEKINRALARMASLPLGTLPWEEIKTLQNKLEELGVEAAQQQLFHADLKLGLPLAPPRLNVEELENALAIWSKLTPRFSPQEILLDRFKKRFAEKYETAEVPLAEALDPEWGIGFPAAENIGDSGYNSLAGPVHLRAKTAAGRHAAECNTWLYNKIESLHAVGEEIVIEENDLAQFSDKLDQLANHFTVMGTWLPSGEILLQHAGGAHPNSLLGRFTHLDERMHALCKQLSLAETRQNEQVIFAEIVHAPEGRVGNIARHAALAAFEIPILSSAGVDEVHQLPLADIMLSVQRDELVLRSRKWNKRVIPRLSNAHNYVNSAIPVYKFLAAVQHQGKPGLEIGWGTLPRYKRFLPRIRYRNFILHRATWFIQETDIQAIFRSANRLDALKVFLSRWKVARLVSFCEGDNELLIDTANDSYLQLLLEEMKGNRCVRLAEWLHGSGKEGKEASFIHQFILPLSKRRPAAIRPFSQKRSRAVRRVFVPGTEWAYYKFYCGASAADTVLLKVVKPLVHSLLANGTIDKAFFIRYTDPHYHIRFRLHLAEKNGRFFSAVTEQVCTVLNPFVQNRTVWKMEAATYVREIERYGEAYMQLTEDVFFYDSLLFLACMEDKLFRADQQVRFMAAVKNIDKWLSLFNMSTEERVVFCTRMSGAFSGEYGTGVRQAFDDRYREWKRSVAHFLEGRKLETVFKERENQLQKLALPIEHITSYIHMSMNRWFATEQRLMEYMAYHFCGRYYNQLAHITNGS